ncbi:acyl-CoA dehydrogenase [Nocardioides marmoribigeumensis]|uniref:Alkylation response protein AidB-like acyl-CoA dehydrogenase n=1 Tax=Nocardioides marmoribigeumensis TaxID=433649 RepID=A0ABU2C1R1_9ACTN|nr:acyl-CoA dehydrogenase [Nocardioides marmoribigeumensis]MDR7364618.1 alkylation response protein AidB-like acyl-CoA dehydrogenase [Nocardioides marmoribigeumensis]
MRFALTETQEAVAGVAAQALGRAACSWQDLAEAGLLALPLPGEYDGEGLGLPEIGVLLRAVGSHAAVDLPVWETLVCGVLPVVAHGTDAQRKRLLPGVAAGETRLAAALNEPGAATPLQPGTRLTRDGEDWRLDGLKVHVSGASDAAALLVSASSDEGSVVVVLEPSASGVTLVESRSSREVAEHTLHLDAVRVRADDVLGGAPGTAEAAAAAQSLREHAVAGLCLLGDGLLAGARDLTAGYVKERRQFGRSLAEFQAVAMQVADVYVAARTVGLAATSAAWRVSEGLPAADDLAVAAYWLASRGPAALGTCHHVHGGMGVDITYPLPRFSSYLKDVVRLLGGEEATLAAVPPEETEGKNLELTEDQRAFKAEVRAYFSTLVSPEDRRTLLTERHGETYERIVKQMGADGWMGVGWPTEYGGKGLGEVEQQVFVNEAARADVHLPAVTLQTVGPTLMAHGTEEQKERFLGPILKGDVHFAIGYSEPDAGTDLASLRCSARRDPSTSSGGAGDYIVNGQKMWTTGGHAADYVWLAVRTDPEAPKHKGISVLIVDTTDPGYSWTPIITADNSHHVNATYYSDVRVPVSMRVGEENAGWRLITSQLNHERVMLAPAGRLEGLRDDVLAWARTQSLPDGTSVADLPAVRRLLGRMTAAFRVNELLNWQVCEAAAEGEPSVADASASKVFASEELQEVGRMAEEVVGAYADPADPATAELLHFLDSSAKRFLVVTFGGGVNEVQRELVCMFGLGLPKVPR